MLSVSSIPYPRALYLPKRMDIREIRRRNLALLRQQVGSLRAVAERVDTDPNYLSQLLGASEKHQMGHRMARRLETAFGKQEGWMDRDNSEQDDQDVAEITQMLKRLPGHQRDTIKMLVRSMLPTPAPPAQRHM